MSRAGVVSILLSAWLGAAVLVTTVVAPAAFAVLPSRTLAGALVGRVLPVLFIAGLVVALASLSLDSGDHGRAIRVRRAMLIVAAVSCAAAQFAVAPRIERVRKEIAGPVEQLSPDDPRRAAFGRLHAASVAWLGVAMVADVTTLILVSLRKWS
ncbi:MAG TPA: DUF4149 domain-containing protein [Gemmatimonadaceae bacterium]